LLIGQEELGLVTDFEYRHHVQSIRPVHAGEADDQVASFEDLLSHADEYGDLDLSGTRHGDVGHREDAKIRDKGLAVNIGLFRSESDDDRELNDAERFLQIVLIFEDFRIENDRVGVHGPGKGASTFDDGFGKLVHSFLANPDGSMRVRSPATC
jgi:hypothetical protein